MTPSRMPPIVEMLEVWTSRTPRSRAASIALRVPPTLTAWSSWAGAVNEYSPPTWKIASQALAGASAVRVGEILCATEIAATAGAKRALGRPGRLAVDLESWAVAQAATRAGIPWLAIRVIIDPVELELPAFARVPGPPRGGYVGPALRHALGGPRAVLALVDLARRARTASRSLERAVRTLGGLAIPGSAEQRTEGRPAGRTERRPERRS
jgi:hypothetical protein